MRAGHDTRRLTRRPPPPVIHLGDGVTVEVAIGAFRQAERPVNVNAEGFYPKHAATSLRKASARWLMACLASGSISPKVRVPPAGRKMGS